MMRWIVILLVVYGFMTPATGCRYTIREIGYSELILGQYKLAMEVDTAVYTDQVKQFVNLAYVFAMDANIEYEIKYQEQKSPVIIYQNYDGLEIDRQEVMSLSEIKTALENFMNSPLRCFIGDKVGESFAFIVCFSAKKDQSHVKSIVDEALVQFSRISDHLDKEVREVLVPIFINEEGIKKEVLLLKSLGVDANSHDPVCLVVYGRGRLAGPPMIGEVLTTKEMLKQLVTIGTDCECGIDLNPILKTTIPFIWNEQRRQTVAVMLGFDVDHPMVLSEMAMILSKTNSNKINTSANISPVLELNNDLDSIKDNVKIKDSVNEGKSILWMIAFSVLLIIGVGLFLFYRGRQ